MEITEGRRFFINSGMQQRKSCQEGASAGPYLAFHPSLSERRKQYFSVVVESPKEHPENLRLIRPVMPGEI